MSAKRIGFPFILWPMLCSTGTVPRAAAAADEPEVASQIRSALAQREFEVALEHLCAGSTCREATRKLCRKLGGDEVFKLLVPLAVGLFDLQRDDPFLKISSELLEAYPYHSRADALRTLRIRALARSGAATLLEDELRPLDEHLAYAAAGNPLRAAAANALLALARRPPSTSTRPIALLEQAGSYRETAGGKRARLELAEQLIAAGKLERAAAVFEEAAAVAAEPARADALYRALAALGRHLASNDRERVRQKYLRLGKRYAESYAGTPRAEEIHLTLTGLAAAAHWWAELAEIGTVFLRRYPASNKRAEVVAQTLQALNRADRLPSLYELATAELGRCGRGATLSCATLRQTAARAASLLRDRALDGKRWSEAHLWAERATDGTRPEARMLVAGLAAKAGLFDKAMRTYRSLSNTASRAPLRSRALAALAQLQEARGQLTEAARTYQALSLQSSSTADRAHWLSLAGDARLHSGDRETIINTARWLRKVVESGQLPEHLFETHQLKVGTLFATSDGEAYKHYMRLFRLWRASRPQFAALCLVRASAFEPSPPLARDLLRQAEALATRRPSRAAVEGTLRLCELERRRLRVSNSSRGERLASLNRLRLPLESAIAKDAKTWRGKAAPCLTWVYESIAELVEAGAIPANVPSDDGARYRAAVRELAAGLRESRHDLDPTPRAASAPPLTVASLLPPRTDQAAPILDLIADRRFAAAEHVATRSLAVAGPRADLYCARGAARLAMRQLAGTVKDFRRALALELTPGCDRAKLETILRWAGAKVPLS